MPKIKIGKLLRRAAKLAGPILIAVATQQATKQLDKLTKPKTGRSGETGNNGPL